MVSAQNIQDVQFTSVMGGYKRAEVDAFLDQCAATVEELNQTIEENTRKMQVLAETIVEYRNQEDSIRAAVLGAQRMSESVIAEANDKAAAIIAEAEEKASHIADEAKKEIQAETEELTRIQKEVAAFRSRLLATYREHLTLIGILTEEDKSVPSEAIVAEEIPAPAVEEVPVAVAEEVPAAEETPVISVPADEVKFDISAFALDDED